MLRTAAFAIALTTAAALAAATSVTNGLAIARDGDSLRVDGKDVRLFGIDAPEFDQSCKRDGQSWSCGQAAADQLARLVTGRQISCITVDTDDYGRAVSRCNVIGKDVNAAMVESGYALAYRRYSVDYVAAEDRAKAGKRGLWSGTFTAPSDYRQAQRAFDAPPAPRRRSQGARTVAVAHAGGCTIKGNQGSNGWIYHLPGMPYYAQTRPEQMFCTEAAARAAGYRRAIVR